MTTIAKRALSAFATCGLSVALAGCGEPPPEGWLGGSSAGAASGTSYGATDEDEIGVTRGALVSGASRVTVGDSSSESEAVITITTEPNGTVHTIVTANADDPGKIVYSNGGTPTNALDDTRVINLNSSQMVMYHRFGLSGAYTATRIAPPDGGALWGDPAIASSGPYVFATSLRVAAGRFPTNGVNRYALTQRHGDSIIPYLVGACIARSNNYGQTWSMAMADCAYDAGHFYDGGAVIANPQGKVFAAWVDVTANEIDVWRTDGFTGAIYQTSNPFPGKSMKSHPRMKLSPAGHVFVMAIDNANRLWMNRYVSHAWQTPTLVASNVTFYNSVYMADGTELRQGPGFDFSVYQSPFDASTQVAFVHTAIVSGKSNLKSGGCNASSSGTWSCAMIAGGQSNPAVDCFNPAIATGFWSPAPGVGAPSTKVTYQRMLSTGAKVALHVSPHDFSVEVVRVSGWQVPCPDYRGYWGDYDSMAVASDGFHRVFSDSTGAACSRQYFTQMPLGVSEAVIPIR